jgi:NADH-quinone oxidoreductase subunit M
VLLTVTVFAPLVGAVLLAVIPSARPAGGTDAQAATAAATGARTGDPVARWVGLAASLATLGLAVAVAVRFQTGEAGFQLGQQADWVRSLGVRYKVGVDGISLPLVLLTTLLVPLAVIASWHVTDRPRAYVAGLLVLETAMLGVFVALDLFLFYIFWEAVLVPAYFLIGSWGGERRVYAAVKFFLYTLLGGLLMLVGIVALWYLQSRATGTGSFDYETLRDLPKDPSTQRWLFAAFFAAFAVKTPLVPFHTWLPAAYVTAPTSTTVLLAGVMSKLGIYGFIRLCLPLLPAASRYFAPAVMALAAVSILYCALIAVVQRDFKRLVAYSSVSHLGFIVLGVFAVTSQSLSGGVLQMINHGLSTGALFLLVGWIYERRHTRQISELRGIQTVAPIFAGVFTVVMLSSIGVPGLNGFVGEYLILIGSFLTSRWWTVAAAAGVILAALYLLWAYQRVFHGEVDDENRSFHELKLREGLVMSVFVGLIVFIGIYPKPLLDRIEPSVDRLIEHVEARTDIVVPRPAPQEVQGEG